MKSLNPACKLIGLVVPTLLLAGLHHPAVNLAVFAAVSYTHLTLPTIA